MIFVSYTKTDKYYEFTTADGIKLLAPVSSIILVDDESGAVTVKTVGSRKQIGIIAQTN